VTVIVLFGHGLGLSPDESARGVAARNRTPKKHLQAVTRRVPSGHGLGLSPGMSPGAA
jgi:hypothetical protein